MMAMVNPTFQCSNNFNNYSNQNNYLIQTVPSIQHNDYEQSLSDSSQNIQTIQNQSSSPIQQSYQDQYNQSVYYYTNQPTLQNSNNNINIQFNNSNNNNNNNNEYQYFNQPNQSNQPNQNFIEYHVKQEFNNSITYEYTAPQQVPPHNHNNHQVSISIEPKKRSYDQMSPSNNYNSIMTSPIQNSSSSSSSSLSSSYYCPNSPNSPNSTSSLYQTFNISQLSQPPSPNFINNNSNSGTPIQVSDEELEEQFKEYLSPSLSNITEKEQLSTLINDYFEGSITLRDLLNELKEFQFNNSTFLNNLLELFLLLDQSNIHMIKYLRENGVDENDLAIDQKRISLLLNEFENGLRGKDKSFKKSTSRGLRNPPNKWTKEESSKLIQLVHENGDKQWKKIAVQIGGGKTGAQCAQHWKRVLCPAIRKGSWDEEEEAKLFILVEKHGQSWKNVASEIRTRTDIQCRYQYFKSCMSREVPWSSKEDEILQKKVIESKQDGKEIGWMDLSKSMARARQTKIPRTALECKIRWECISMGSIIDGLHDNISSNF